MMGADVLVVGAGPAGLTAAAELARYGVAVRIIERNRRPSPHSRALFLWSRTLELLDRAGIGENFVAAGLKVRAANIIADGKPIGRIDFSAISSPHPYALMLPQAQTEALLEAHLNGLGVVVERGVRLDFFLDDGGAVKSVIAHAGGERETVETSWLIGCDGARSTVRDELDLANQSHTTANDWVLADVALSGFDAPADELFSYWHEDGFLAIFPIAGGQYRIIADIGAAKTAHPAEPTLLGVQHLLDRRGPARLQASDPIWLAGFRVQERNVGQYRSQNVFLAGDAAHLHNPAGAQGMNMGMHDAFDLAWKLALARTGACSGAALLSSYDAERRPVADHVIGNVHRLTALSTMKNAAAQRARNLLGGFLLGLAPARRAAAAEATEIALSYRTSPMIGPDDGSFPIATPGERMPPVTGQTPVGAGERPLFALFAEENDETRRFMREFADLLEPDIRPALATSCMWLVRPDGYVAAVGLAGDIRGFYKYFEKLNAQKKEALF
jgi:2-polyprenyl-6-methoxyphenol hydroxylase-like FAD-dependent oxidoreductase